MNDFAGPNEHEIEVVGIDARGGDDQIVVDFGENAAMQVHLNGGSVDLGLRPDSLGLIRSHPRLCC
nr:hypothetical protein [Rhodopirellula sp. SM50]